MDPVGKSLSSEDCASETTQIASEEATCCSQIAKLFFAVPNYFYPINPVLGVRKFRYLPVFVEKWMGKLMYPIMTASQGGEVTNLPDQTKLSEILQKLRAHAKRDLDYEVKIVNNNAINAWCLPGGKIAVYNRLLERIDSFLLSRKESLRGYTHPQTGEHINYNDVTKEDVLAALLGHEMTHADARHTARKLELSFIVQASIFGLQSWTTGWINQKQSRLENKKAKLSSPEIQREENAIAFYQRMNKVAFSLLNKIGIELYFLMGSRRHELEADKYGTRLAWEARYNPKGALFLQEVLKSDVRSFSAYLPSPLQKVYKLFLSHPTCEDRQRALFQDVKNWTAQKN